MLWVYCLSMEQFMTIQYQLLAEQIELLKRCELGRKAMRGVESITTYADYPPCLLEKRDDMLPEKPIF